MIYIPIKDREDVKTAVRIFQKFGIGRWVGGEQLIRCYDSHSEWVQTIVYLVYPYLYYSIANSNVEGKTRVELSELEAYLKLSRI